MAVNLKVAAGLTALFAIMAAATFLTLPKPLFYTFLNQESEYERNFLNNNKETIGGSYGKYLVGTFGKNNINKIWWSKSWDKYIRDKKSNNVEFSEEFKDVVRGFSEFEIEKNALNIVCNSVYLLSKEKIVGLEDSNEERLKRDLWSYCSPANSHPMTIKERYKEKNPYKEETNIGKQYEEQLLAAFHKKDNSFFWERKTIEFYKVNNDEKKGYFSNFRRQYRMINSSLRIACDLAYKKNSGETEGEPDVSEVIEFCSL